MFKEQKPEKRNQIKAKIPWCVKRADKNIETLHTFAY